MRSGPDATQEVLILSDGTSDCRGESIAAARALQSKAKVFALFIGSTSAAGKQELTNYISLPSKDHLFSVLNYDELDTLVHDSESLALLCVPFSI